jgi:hypothetical protein
MKRKVFFGVLAVVVLLVFAMAVFSQTATKTAKKTEKKVQMPFGGKEDVAFANDMWKAMKDYNSWLMKSEVRMGMSPHGDFIQLYYNIVNLNGKPYHVIVKDNFGGEGATKDLVTESPSKYLMAVTVMVQREKGYDLENNDWFWVKYNADGTIGKDEKGTEMAGRVAKGMDTGCISCHKAAKDNDYIFTNDAQ